ncbi:Uncharacterised protein [Vibrio cholerae]|nr:Uncharacterised protein [Vibrio cholerae]CSI14484.1 Uncharacterised protein [Vibrio cholerae]
MCSNNSPLTRISPPVGATIPANMRARVDFPEPF